MYIRSVLGVRSRECRRDGWRSSGILPSALYPSATEDGLFGEDGTAGLEGRGEEGAACAGETGKQWAPAGFVCVLHPNAITSETATVTPKFGWGITRRDGLGVATGMVRVFLVGGLRGDDGGSSGTTKG
jgi:hypothetical protein